MCSQRRGGGLKSVLNVTKVKFVNVYLKSYGSAAGRENRLGLTSSFI